MENNNHPAPKNGKICFIEIPAIDITISSTFYKEVFGWNILIRGDGNITFDDKANGVNGTWVTNRKPASEPGFLIYIMVDNIELSIRSVIAAGGKIVQPVGMDLPQITARFSDPAGNIIGLYQDQNN